MRIVYIFFFTFGNFDFDDSGFAAIIVFLKNWSTEVVFNMLKRFLTSIDIKYQSYKLERSLNKMFRSFEKVGFVDCFFCKLL